MDAYEMCHKPGRTMTTNSQLIWWILLSLLSLFFFLLVVFFCNFTNFPVTLHCGFCVVFGRVRLELLWISYVWRLLPLLVAKVVCSDIACVTRLHTKCDVWCECVPHIFCVSSFGSNHQFSAAAAAAAAPVYCCWMCMRYVYCIWYLLMLAA